MTVACPKRFSLIRSAKDGNYKQFIFGVFSFYFVIFMESYEFFCRVLRAILFKMTIQDFKL